LGFTLFSARIPLLAALAAAVAVLAWTAIAEIRRKE
jgi:hypothetical protein